MLKNIQYAHFAKICKNAAKCQIAAIAYLRFSDMPSLYISTPHCQASPNFLCVDCGPVLVSRWCCNKLGTSVTSASLSL